VPIRLIDRHDDLDLEQDRFIGNSRKLKESEEKLILDLENPRGKCMKFMKRAKQAEARLADLLNKRF